MSARREAHRGVVLAIVLTGYLLVLIDVSILMVALPRIHHDLRFSPTSLSWAQNAYTLTFGGLLLLGALAAILAAPRFLPETAPHPGRLDLGGALSSTLGVSALVFGIVHSADAGGTDPVTLASLAAGLVLVGVFIANQKQSPQPLMPLRLFASRQRTGAYLARFLFNGALLSFYFFMSQYLQGVTGDPPLEAGVAFLPPRSPPSPLPMIVFGIGQGLGLSTLTTGGMAGVVREDAGVAGGLVNVAHHTGGALGLGILVTIFAAAGSGAHGAQLLADRVSASLTGGAAFVALAVIVTVITRPPSETRRRRLTIHDQGTAPCRSRATLSTATPGPANGSPARCTSTLSPHR